jgi:hypothetical protein
LREQRLVGLTDVTGTSEKINHSVLAEQSHVRRANKVFSLEKPPVSYGAMNMGFRIVPSLPTQVLQSSGGTP